MEGFFTTFLFYFSTLQIFLSNVDLVQSQRYKNIPEHAGYKKSRIACYDNNRIVLKCTEPYIIHVEIVDYGKNSRETTCREDCCEGPKDCAIRHMTNQSAQFDDVSRTCDEKRSCEVMYPDDIVALEGCGGNLDYIIVHYGCQLPHEIMFPTIQGENPTTESSTIERITTSKATTITTTAVATPTTTRLTSTTTTAATENLKIELKTTSALSDNELLTIEYKNPELSLTINNQTITDRTDISISVTTLADNAANSDNRKSTTIKYILGTSTNSTSILSSPTHESQFSSTFSQGNSETQQKDDFNTHHELTTNRFTYDTTLSKFSSNIVTQQEDDESFEDDDDTSTVRNHQSNDSVIEEDVSAVFSLDFTSRTNLLILAGIGVALLLAIAITTACTAWAITTRRRERRVERRENRENYRRRAQMSTPYIKQSSKYKASDKRWDDDEYDSLHENARL